MAAIENKQKYTSIVQRLTQETHRTTGHLFEADVTTGQKVVWWNKKKRATLWWFTLRSWLNLKVSSTYKWGYKTILYCNWQDTSRLKGKQFHLGSSKPRQTFLCCSVPSLMFEKISEFQLFKRISSDNFIHLFFPFFIWLSVDPKGVKKKKSPRFSFQTARSSFHWDCQTFIQQHLSFQKDDIKRL